MGIEEVARPRHDFIAHHRGIVAQFDRQVVVAHLQIELRQQQPVQLVLRVEVSLQPETVAVAPVGAIHHVHSSAKVKAAAVRLDRPLEPEPKLVQLIFIASIVRGHRAVPSISRAQGIERDALLEPPVPLDPEHLKQPRLRDHPFFARLFGRQILDLRLAVGGFGRFSVRRVAVAGRVDRLHGCRHARRAGDARFGNRGCGNRCTVGPSARCRPKASPCPRGPRRGGRRRRPAAGIVWPAGRWAGLVVLRRRQAQCHIGIDLPGGKSLPFPLGSIRVSRRRGPVARRPERHGATGSNAQGALAKEQAAVESS